MKRKRRNEPTRQDPRSKPVQQPLKPRKKARMNNTPVQDGGSKTKDSIRVLEDAEHAPHPRPSLVASDLVNAGLSPGYVNNSSNNLFCAYAT